MNYARIMVLTLCAEEATITLVYLYQRDFRQAIYWAAATVIGLAVVW